MPLGGSKKEVTLRKPAAEALDHVKEAFESVGKLKSVEDEKLLVRGTTRYGLQKVHLKASITSSSDGSVVSIKAQGDDVWGKAARTAVEKLADALAGSER